MAKQKHNILLTLILSLLLIGNAYGQENNGIGSYDEELYDVRVTRNVTYAKAMGYWASFPKAQQTFAELYAQRLPYLAEQRLLALTMDVYEPIGDNGCPRPLLLIIHGGAFFSGDKEDEEYVEWCRRFASCGYTAVSINYRMGFRPLDNAVERAAYRAVQDANAAIRYLLAHDDKYHIDADRIFVAGCSAGAITALNVAFMNNDNRPISTRGGGPWNNTDQGDIESLWVDGDMHQPFRVRAVGNMWGAIFDLDMLQTAPTPIISIHSIEDPVVPCADGIPFTEMIKQIAYERTRVSPLVDQLLPGVQSVLDLALDCTLNATANVVMPIVYGSQLIDIQAKKIGMRSRFIAFDEQQHTLVRDNETGELNALHDSLFVEMSAFFADEMTER